MLNLDNAVGGSIADPQAVATIFSDDAPNDAPDCSGVTADSSELWPPNHVLHAITLSGATDADGDAVQLTITGVTQDEPTNGRGDGDIAPDAVAGSASNEVKLRAERAGRGDGRVYRIAYTGTDGSASCSGTAFVGVRHAVPQAPIDSGAAFDSFS